MVLFGFLFVFFSAFLPLDIGTTVIKSLQEIGDFSLGKVISDRRTERHGTRVGCYLMDSIRSLSLVMDFAGFLGFKNPEKIDKRADPNKSVQGRILVQIK